MEVPVTRSTQIYQPNFADSFFCKPVKLVLENVDYMVNNGIDLAEFH